mmetsp:Transcript_38281/g.46735  ORF Transcript_38281/g.46735 Transcript_38281/m.46735 type:complete len:213 (-) Transcript_38281:1416-2054(-)
MVSQMGPVKASSDNCPLPARFSFQHAWHMARAKFSKFSVFVSNSATFALYSGTERSWFILAWLMTSLALWPNLMVLIVSLILYDEGEAVRMKVVRQLPPRASLRTLVSFDDLYGTPLPVILSLDNWFSVCEVLFLFFTRFSVKALTTLPKLAKLLLIIMASCCIDVEAAVALRFFLQTPLISLPAKSTMCKRDNLVLPVMLFLCSTVTIKMA